MKLKLIGGALVFAVVATACVSALKKGRVDRSPAQAALTDEMKNKAIQGFQTNCSGCHNQFLEPSSFIQNGKLVGAGGIYVRMMWTAKGENIFKTHEGWQNSFMPLFISEESYKGQKDTLEAMFAFAREGAPDMENYLKDYDLSRLNVPPDFKVSILARVPGARSMAVAKDGTIFVGTGGFSNPLKVVYRVRPGGEVEKFIDGLDNPNGVAILGNDLYVAEASRLSKFENAVSRAPNQEPLKAKDGILIKEFPVFPIQWRHNWKYLRPGPNHTLYYTMGAPCNSCEPENEKEDAPRPPVEKFGQAAIHRLDPNDPEHTDVVIAQGVRNSIGFDIRPGTQDELWFTENGRDELGDDLPNDELNMVSHIGEHFGWPYCMTAGDKVVEDPKLKNKEADFCTHTTAPMVALDPHSAALGMRFYRSHKFPKKYRNAIFLAEHGSWNRKRLSGYQVVMVNPKTRKAEPFITGWLNKEMNFSWGRPSDIEQAADGSLLISDDGVPGTNLEGAIYRVEYTGKSLQ